jgi:hypothetical protein
MDGIKISYSYKSSQGTTPPPPLYIPSTTTTQLDTKAKMSFDAETAGNFEEIEMQFAVKTVEHLEVRSSLEFGRGTDG